MTEGGVGQWHSTAKGKLSPCSVLMKRLFQCSFCRENGCDQNDALNRHKNDPEGSEHTFTAVIEWNMDQDRRHKHDAADFPPKTSAVIVSKFPCIHVLHGARRSVSHPMIDLLGTTFPHHSSGEQHDGGNEQIADEHKPPKPHRMHPHQLRIFVWDILSYFLVFFNAWGNCRRFLQPQFGMYLSASINTALHGEPSAPDKFSGAAFKK